MNGFGLGRIPWHEVRRYAETYAFDHDDTESLIDLIELLDVEEAKLTSTKDKPNGPQRTTGT